MSLADKVANARAILADYRTVDEKVFERLTGKKAGTLWYYCALLKAFRGHNHDALAPLVRELERNVTELQRVAHMEGDLAEPMM